MKNYRRAIVFGCAAAIALLLSSCGKDISRNTANGIEKETTLNTMSALSEGNPVKGNTEMDTTVEENTSANFRICIPKGWELYNDQLPQTYNNNSNLEEQTLFFLAIDGYAKEFSGDYLETPIEGLPTLMDKQITNDIPEITNESLQGTEITQEIVTLNGMDLLKVTGKTTASESYSYIAYFGFNTSVKWDTTDVPFVVMMFIKGEDQTNIARGEKILNDCMATFKTIEE